MRTFVASTLFLIASHCPAQMMPMGLTSKSTLLQVPEIQRELKVTPDQLSKINSTREEARRIKDTESMNDMQHPYRTVDPKLVVFLQPSQQTRLHQLFLQENGLISLSEQDVQKPLALSKEKQESAIVLIDELMAKVMSHLADLPAGGLPDPNKIEGFKRQAHQDLNALLDNDEKKRWKVMQGKPFRFPKSMRPHG